MTNTYYDIYFDFKGETKYTDLPKTRRDIDSIDRVDDILNDQYDRAEFGWDDPVTDKMHYVGEAIDALICKLKHGEYTGDEEAFLNLHIIIKGHKGNE